MGRNDLGDHRHQPLVQVTDIGVLGEQVQQHGPHRLQIPRILPIWDVGNVVGQAIASGVIVAVMAANGFDIPLDEISDTAGAAAAFVQGWRVAYALVTAYALVGLLLAISTKPPAEGQPSEASRQPSAVAR